MAPRTSVGVSGSILGVDFLLVKCHQLSRAPVVACVRLEQDASRRGEKNVLNPSCGKKVQGCMYGNGEGGGESTT